MKHQLTYKSKIVWDDILHHSLPIETHYLTIPKPYILEVLRKAIVIGLLDTNTRFWCNLYAFRNSLPVYIDECTFAELLYRIDVPVYYESAKLCDNRKFKFYAKIKSADLPKLKTFIWDSVNIFVDHWYENYKQHDWRELYTLPMLPKLEKGGIDNV